VELCAANGAASACPRRRAAEAAMSPCPPARVISELVHLEEGYLKGDARLVKPFPSSWTESSGTISLTRPLPRRAPAS
jgi:hypothetical protein